MKVINILVQGHNSRYQPVVYVRQVIKFLERVTEFNKIISIIQSSKHVSLLHKNKLVTKFIY